jgi:hypothetical protein
MMTSQCYKYIAWFLVLASGCSRGAAVTTVGVRQPPLGFVLESTLHAHRLYNGGSDILLELGNDATVVDGDRLQVSIRTSRDAYLYLAFCSENAMERKYSGLKVFPHEGALRVQAYEPTIVPGVAGSIVLDNKPGREVFYLILSRDELSESDSEPARVIAFARQGRQATDCGIQNMSAPNRAWHSPLGSGRRPTSPSAHPGKSPRTDEHAEEDPVVEIQRGGDIVWNDGVSGVEADQDGIVILRFNLTHVAAR